MQIEVKMDAAVSETKVIVLTNAMTDEVKAVLRKLTETDNKMIVGFQDDIVTVLDEKEITRIYASNGKVYAVLPSGEYWLKHRLYELEERLKPFHFVRISNAELVNLKNVKTFDLSYTGTICVSLTDGGVAYVSRRYVGRIKEVLGI